MAFVDTSEHIHGLSRGLGRMNFSEAPSLFCKFLRRVALGKITNTNSLTVSEALAANHQLILHCLRVIGYVIAVMVVDINKSC